MTRRPDTPYRWGMTPDRHSLRTARLERLVAELRAEVLSAEDHWRADYLTQWVGALANLRRLVRKLKPNDGGPDGPAAA